MNNTCIEVFDLSYKDIMKKQSAFKVSWGKFKKRIDEIELFLFRFYKNLVSSLLNIIYYLVLIVIVLLTISILVILWSIFIGIISGDISSIFTFIELLILCIIDGMCLYLIM